MRPVSVSTSTTQMCVPKGHVKFGGSKVWSAASVGSTPSGRFDAMYAASATSWIVVPLSVPLTLNRPPPNSRSSSAASSRCAAIVRALAMTLSAARCTAVPPTARLREP